MEALRAKCWVMCCSFSLLSVRKLGIISIAWATGPFIIVAGGTSNILFLHRLVENIQDAFAEAASIAEQTVSYIRTLYVFSNETLVKYPVLQLIPLPYLSYPLPSLPSTRSSILIHVWSSFHTHTTNLTHSSYPWTYIRHTPHAHILVHLSHPCFHAIRKPIFLSTFHLLRTHRAYPTTNPSHFPYIPHVYMLIPLHHLPSFHYSASFLHCFPHVSPMPEKKEYPPIRLLYYPSY